MDTLLSFLISTRKSSRTVLVMLSRIFISSTGFMLIRIFYSLDYESTLTKLYFYYTTHFFPCKRKS